MKNTLVLSSLAVGVILFLSAGCGKKEEASNPEAAPETTDQAAAEEAPAATPPPAAPAPGAGQIPGENGVRSALAAKDYQGAVGQLMAMRGSVKQDQWEHYVSLQYEVRNALGDASDADPKAAEALMTLNAMNRGR